MVEYDLHAQNHESDENSSSLLNSCLSTCQALIMRQLQSAQDPDIYCDPGAGGFVEDSHSQKFCFCFFATVAEAASDLWDVGWGCDSWELEIWR